MLYGSEAFAYRLEHWVVPFGLIGDVRAATRTHREGGQSRQEGTGRQPLKNSSGILRPIDS